MGYFSFTISLCWELLVILTPTNWSHPFRWAKTHSPTQTPRWKSETGWLVLQVNLWLLPLETIHVNVLTQCYFSKICHAHVLISYDVCKVFPPCKTLTFRGLTQARMFGHARSGHTLTRAHDCGWWSEREVRRWGGSLSSPPDLWVLLIPSRLKARVPLDMNASLIREIIFALSKFLGGATSVFSHRRSRSELHRVIKSHLKRRRQRDYRRREFPQVSKFFWKGDPDGVT